MSHELSYIKNKGGTVLLNEEYQYYKVKSFKNGAIMWRCALYKKNKCSGNIISMGNDIRKKKAHSCVPDLSQNLVLKEFEHLKETVANTIEPIPQLHQNFVTEIENSGLDLVTNVPSLSSVQHKLYEIRNKELGVKKTVYNKFKDVEVPIKFIKSILADYYDEVSRILVFCSPEAKKIMPAIEECFGDATFASCPAPFYQLYIIHGEIGSSITHTRTVPLIYALMPDKKQTTYSIMFELIKRQLPQFSPKKMHCDFEKGAMNGIRAVYPGIQLKGCYYHWNRALWRKGKKLGLKSKSDKRIIGLAAALPLLPPQNIEQGLEYIKSECLNKLKRVRFCKYIKKFWLTKNFTEILSVFSEKHRTNNVTEAFHSKLRKTVNKRNSTIVRLLVTLKSMESFAMSNSSKIKRKNVYIDNDEDIITIQLQLITNEISVGYALEKLR